MGIDLSIIWAVIILFGIMLARQRQVFGGRLQCDQVPLARQVQRFTGLLPARDAQQLRAQQVDALVFVRGQVNVRGVFRRVDARLMAGQVDLVPHAHHRHALREVGDDGFVMLVSLKNTKSGRDRCP